MSPKLGTYEEIHNVFASYFRFNGIDRFLSAAGNDRYGRTLDRANHIYESPCGVTDALREEVRLEYGLCENVRTDEKLTAFLELERAVHELAADALL